MQKEIYVLLIEDSKYDEELILYHLRKSGIHASSERVFCEEAMRKALRSREWNVILSDHFMPSFDSFEAISIRNEICPQVPFIIVSSCLEEVMEKSAIEKGCCACIPKSNLNKLGEIIKEKLNPV
ncbi:MAG: response regulator [Clostridia bacterium]|nr:response regulator [Clostridia bacterium]